MKSATYWQDKVSIWLHDPVCKVFDLIHHEEIAKTIASHLFQSEPDKSLYQIADMIASSFTRAAVPGYSENQKENGAVSFAPHLLLLIRLQQQNKSCQIQQHRIQVNSYLIFPK